jgi:hypothetical protein
VRYGLRSPDYKCQGCQKQEQRNCHNRKGYAEPLLLLPEWPELPASVKHVEKWGDLKILACPMSTITSQTWEILRIVDVTLDAEGNIACLPYPGAYLEQPIWYRQAVDIVRRERSEHRRKEMEKRRGSR